MCHDFLGLSKVYLELINKFRFFCMFFIPKSVHNLLKGAPLIIIIMKFYTYITIRILMNNLTECLKPFETNKQILNEKANTLEWINKWEFEKHNHGMILHPLFPGQIEIFQMLFFLGGRKTIR